VQQESALTPAQRHGFHNRFNSTIHMRRGLTVLAASLAILLPGSSFAQTKPVAPMPPTGTAPKAETPLATLPKLSDTQLYQLRTDWPMLERYRDANAKVSAPSADEKRVVFMGDSITEGWMNHGTGASETTPGFFPGKPFLDRGISGQTTPQMLIRFRPDVIDLKPAAVVLFAGINDIAGNTGDMTLEATEGNLASMAELAKENGIKVVICSILPAFDFPWRPGREPAPKVVKVNEFLKSYAAEHGHVYVDFYTAMVDSRGGLPTNLSHDGVHPTPAGYAIMNPLVEAGIAQALSNAAKPTAPDSPSAP
jgi:lysophospholipase L1-like esterase